MRSRIADQSVCAVDFCASTASECRVVVNHYEAKNGHPNLTRHVRDALTCWLKFFRTQAQAISG